MVRHCTLSLLALLWLLLAPAAHSGEEILGTAVKVFDGDSFILKTTRGREVEARLGEIDAPEQDQPFADPARATLRSLILNRQLRLVVTDTDQYGRKVARAYRVADGVDVNAELVKRGCAWVYRRYLHDQSLLVLERAAREQKVGLWALTEAQRQPPWRWRRTHRPAPAL